MIEMLGYIIIVLFCLVVLTAACSIFAMIMALRLAKKELEDASENMLQKGKQSNDRQSHAVAKT